MDEAKLKGVSSFRRKVVKLWKIAPLRVDLEPGDGRAIVPPLKIPIRREVSDQRSALEAPMYFAHLTLEQKQWLKKELQKLQEAGIIVKEDDQCEDGCVSPALFPRKPNKPGEWRLVFDSRYLNSVVYPLIVDIPDLEALRRSLGPVTASVGPATRFAKVDIVKGYWSIPVRQEDTKYLRFRLPAPFGTWKYNMAPMGFIRSGNYFVACMQNIFQDLIVEGRLLIGTDDLLILGRRRQDTCGR